MQPASHSQRPVRLPDSYRLLERVCSEQGECRQGALLRDGRHPSSKTEISSLVEGKEYWRGEREETREKRGRGGDYSVFQTESCDKHRAAIPIPSLLLLLLLLSRLRVQSYSLVLPVCLPRPQALVAFKDQGGRAVEIAPNAVKTGRRMGGGVEKVLRDCINWVWVPRCGNRVQSGPCAAGAPLPHGRGKLVADWGWRPLFPGGALLPAWARRWAPLAHHWGVGIRRQTSVTNGADCTRSRRKRFTSRSLRHEPLASRIDERPRMAFVGVRSLESQD